MVNAIQKHARHDLGVTLSFPCISVSTCVSVYLSICLAFLAFSGCLSIGLSIYLCVDMYLFMVPGIWEARDCCHVLHSTMQRTLCGVWGVGGGGIIMSFALPHICDATYLYALLHFIHIHTCVMLRFCKFFCASTHTSCYAVGSLALPHIRHATLL